MPRTPRQTKLHAASDKSAAVSVGATGKGAKSTPQKARRVYSDQDIIDALYQHNGLIARVAEVLDCDRKTIYDRCEKIPAVKAALDDSRKYAVDTAEDALHARIKDGDTTAIIFLLKTLGKSRGYVERMEQTGADGQPIENKTVIEVRYVKPNTDS